MEMRSALELLGEFTAEQWGLVTLQQAKKSGVDAVTMHRLKEAGFLAHVRRGVYAATAAVPTTARDEQAAWLTFDPATPAWERDPLDTTGGVVSHASACRLHEVGEFVTDRITFTVPRRRTSRDPDLRFKIASLTEQDVVLLDGLPVTTMARTVQDLLAENADASHLATIIRQAVESGQLRLDTFVEQIAPYARRYRVRPDDGAALLEHLLSHIGLSAERLLIRPQPRSAEASAALASEAILQLREMAEGNKGERTPRERN
ncbi:type IV toxin-antitoxin system AbiEi family antitoxin domain-containing protein [Sciscionella marina]|uniref:type IV toxin-antitoxin system AbiEi family antitoxin domain-containing protein n=1 Tax=Sciscionella marina TaxID=508770 RepID=UPI0003692926|nr:type IV toxin-antitoxin system AbiEi family antitoxin domain-containing protein [Sciscionella marina]